MRKFELWISLLLVVVIPGLMLRIFALRQPEMITPESEATNETQSQKYDENLVRILNNDQVLTMPLDEYLCGVLLGEMPASFHDEALRAQAVAARTYTLRKLRNTDKHIEADLCTDTACCQAYVEPETNESARKIRNAVDSTAGEVLIYEGDLIEATYYSCSGGRTEAAVAVWGTDIPYLQAIDSPWDAGAKYHRDTVVFAENELMEKLGLTGTSEEFTYSNITYTDGDGVESIDICGKQFSGVELRSLLGLRSTAFTIEKDADTICFTTKGYGHRVGMSQYGAESMAQQGNTYEEILAYYYPQTQLITLNETHLHRLFDKEGNL